MESSAVEASQQLNRIEAPRRAVRSKAPFEHRVYLAWGLFVLLFLPPFDVVDGRVWNIVVCGRRSGLERLARC